MGKKRRRYRYPDEFRAMALERMRGCENITALAEELGIHRRLLYTWQKQGVSPSGPAPAAEPARREAVLSREVEELKLLLADKVQEVAFFRGALQKVEARRRRSGAAGEKTSTPKSGS